MDKLVRKIEVPLAKRAVEKAGLYIVPKERIPELARVAGDSYENYPLHNWFAGGIYNPAVTGKIMETSLRTMIKDAVIYADSEELNGFAVWLPMGFEGSKPLPFIFCGGAKIAFEAGPGIIKRLVSYEDFAMKLKKRYTGNTDWYLYNLSVAKKAQGKGIASKLLRPMLDFCDDENMVAYLETSKDINVGVYRHFGFELMEEVPVPESDIMHYAMVRKPKREKPTPENKGY